MNVGVKVNCLCGFSTEAAAKKPSHFSPSTGVFYCSGCESKIQFIVKYSGSGPNRGLCHVQSRVVQMSKTLADIMIEEQAAKIKEFENNIVKEVESGGTKEVHRSENQGA